MTPVDEEAWTEICLVTNHGKCTIGNDYKRFTYLKISVDRDTPILDLFPELVNELVSA